MLWPLSWDDGNWQSMTHTWGGVIILLPLSWDEDNLWGMVHIFGMYNHALSVVMRRRQLAGHAFKDIWYITMLSPLSWDDDNWRSMFHTLKMNTVLWPLSWDDGNWQSMTHSWEGIIILWPLSCNDDNWRSMFHTWMIYYPALTVVMRWRLDKEFFIPYGYRLHQPKKEGTTGAFARTCPLSHGGTIVALECINHH